MREPTPILGVMTSQIYPTLSYVRFPTTSPPLPRGPSIHPSTHPSHWHSSPQPLRSWQNTSPNDLGERPSALSAGVRRCRVLTHIQTENIGIHGGKGTYLVSRLGQPGPALADIMFYIKLHQRTTSYHLSGTSTMCVIKESSAPPIAPWIPAILPPDAVSTESFKRPSLVAPYGLQQAGPTYSHHYGVGTLQV